MKTIELTGVSSIPEEVVIKISTGELSDEVCEQEGKVLVEALLNALPMGTIIQLADQLNEQLAEAIALAGYYKMLKGFAAAIGIELDEEEGGDE